MMVRFNRSAVSVVWDYSCHVKNTVFGVYQRPFNQGWDFLLKRILETGELLSADECTATFKLGDDLFEIWTSNRWYSFAHLYRFNGKYISRSLQARPRFITMRHLHGLVAFVKSPSVTREIFYSPVNPQGGSND